MKHDSDYFTRLNLLYVMLQDIVLDFSPGPIHAVDGDRGLSSSVSYAILSGTIQVNNQTVHCLHVNINNCVCVYGRR